MNLKGLWSTFFAISSAMTAAERLLGDSEIDPHLNHHDHSFKGSLYL